MAGTTIWKGYIHFGDTDVPVKLHTAVREERIQFHLLHSRDQVRLRQQMICTYEKIPVPAEEQSKGFGYPGTIGPPCPDECPFAVKPETNTPVAWVKPELVCEVALSNWTEDVVMRQPVFLRLREDKAARDVVREMHKGDDDT